MTTTKQITTTGASTFKTSEYGKSLSFSIIIRGCTHTVESFATAITSDPYIGIKGHFDTSYGDDALRPAVKVIEREGKRVTTGEGKLLVTVASDDFVGNRFESKDEAIAYVMSKSDRIFGHAINGIDLVSIEL